MNEYRTQFKDYSGHSSIMISTDRAIFVPGSPVRQRMIGYAKACKELHIIIFSTKRFNTAKISENCVIYSTNSLTRWNYIGDAYKIGKRILKKMNDPIFITCQDPFETGLVGKKLAHLRKDSELLLQIHTDLFSPYFTKHSFLNKIRRYISKFTLPQADMVRVVSRRIADSLVERGFKPEEIILKPIAVNTEAIKNAVPSFDLRKKSPQFKKIILMVSRLEPEKNIGMAIEALKIAIAKIPDLGLVIVGSGKELGKLKKLSHKLDLSQKVAFEGWQSDLVSYYKGCDLFLNTSWYEGYGMTLVEAQAAGCRVVSTDVGIARDVGAEIVGWNREEIAGRLLDLFGRM
ncbi:MAG TPA: glycosyltransferase [Candidatus Paceibacterota bacterium]